MSTQNSYKVEFLADGHLRVPAAVVDQYFRWEHTRLQMEEGTLFLLPSTAEAPDALLLKRRNLAGDRSVMLAEFLRYDPPVGEKEACWDSQLRHLRIDLK